MHSKPDVLKCEVYLCELYFNFFVMFCRKSGTSMQPKISQVLQSTYFSEPRRSGPSNERCEDLTATHTYTVTSMPFLSIPRNPRLLDILDILSIERLEQAIFKLLFYIRSHASFWPQVGRQVEKLFHLKYLVRIHIFTIPHHYNFIKWIKFQF